MGPQAPGGQPRGGRPRPGLRRGPPRGGGGLRGQLPHRHGRFAGQGNLQTFYARFDVDEAFARYQATVPRKVLKRAEKQLAKARTKDSMQALAKLTHEVDGEPRINADPR